MFDFIRLTLSPRKRKIIIWALALLLAYTVIGFFILPPIIRSVTAKQISRQIDREVTIQKIKLNPFALSVTVDGLLIKDKDGEPFVSWDEVYVNFQLSSLFGRAWVFSEISMVRPFVRAQMNADRMFNFSDIITKFSTNAPAAKPTEPAKPFYLHVGKLQIVDAVAAVADLSSRTPYQRRLGPLDLSLHDFRTDPDNKNPYAFFGTTDTGEQYSWSGHFAFEPLRSDGVIAINKVALNKYAPLYQDLVSFDIRDGTIALHTDYHFKLGETNLDVSITNTSFALRDFKLAERGHSNNIIELPLLGVTGVSFDLAARQAEVGSLFADGGNLFVSRDQDRDINVVEISKPSDTNAVASGGIVFLLRSVTNAVALLLESTNAWKGTIHEVAVTNCALHLEDFISARPAKLDLTDVALEVRNISNVPTTNLTATLFLRWNTNGTIHTGIAASFSPPTADINLALTNLDLGTLDPYLEAKVNLLILGSKLGLTGAVHLRTPTNDLPQVTFHGNARLDEFRTVDGTLGEDLLKWDSLRINGIDANLNPQIVAVKEIALDNAYARIVIETNKTINLLTALQPANTNAAPKRAFPKIADKTAALTTNVLDKSKAPQFSIGSIVISNAALHFTDNSISPKVDLSISKAGGTIDGISSEQLQHANIKLHALVDKVGPAEITGHINPFSEKETNQVLISIKDVDLTPTSPYSGKFAGYGISRGKLSLDLEYNLVGKKLASKNVITLDQFTFGDKVNSPDATHLPVRLAIAILKDRQGKIVLDVPVEGSLDDPKFRVGKVVMRTVVNILTKVATSPFSLLGAAFGGGEELSYEDFAPGSTELSPESQKKLDTLVKALYERPALQLEIAGSVDTASDRDALQRAALDKQLRTLQWQALSKSERSATTPDQVQLTPGQRTYLVQKLYSEAKNAGKITPELIATNSNLAAAAALIAVRRPDIQKGAAILTKPTLAFTGTTNAPGAVATSPVSKLPPPGDPMEAVLVATIPVSDSDLEALATRRAKAVRAYILQTGKVEDTRLFLTQSQSASVRPDGSRVYLQFQ
jgi:hypothetical protein